MPFCRKCGRRLPEYSESCSECGTSTTAPLIKIKKTAAKQIPRIVAQPTLTKAIAPPKVTVPVKTVAKTHPAKSITLTKPVKVVTSNKSSAPTGPITYTKPAAPVPTNPPHEIIKSNVSLEEDILANPKDYETGSFDFDLKCSNGHFWPEGRQLPVSNGKAFCPQCGELLRKNKPSKRRRHRTPKFP